VGGRASQSLVPDNRGFQRAAGFGGAGQQVALAAADGSMQQNRQVALSHDSPGRFNVPYIFIGKNKKSPSFCGA
jgi:cytochrome c oxidase assembly protein Cox11